MGKFEIHDEKTAPDDARDILRGIKTGFGFIPNAFGLLAESPVTLKSYLDLDKKIGDTSFTEGEQQALMLAVSQQNDCDYCKAAHTLQIKNTEMAQSVVEELVSGNAVSDPKLATLVEFARKIVDKRGRISETDVDKFLDAGYTKANVLEVILVVAQKTITNYMNHILEPEIDEAFVGQRGAA